MKFSTVLLATVALAQDEKKVPPRHPLDRLNRLVEFSAELMNDWFTFLPSKDRWVVKFARNAGRMERNFKRGEQVCGWYDETQLPHGGPEDERRRRGADETDLRYDTADPTVGAKQITTGFSKWAVRYIGQCSGQRDNQFQVDRMIQWNEKLQAHLASQSG